MQVAKPDPMSFMSMMQSMRIEMLLRPNVSMVKVAKKFGSFCLMIMLPIMGACTNMKRVEWTEDVRLSDGRTIIVQRSEEYRQVVDAGAGFQRGWLFQKSSITADLPLTVGRRVLWEGSLKPLVLDIQQGNQVFLVGYVATGAAQDEWRTPRHEFYVAFRLAGEDWQRIPLAELPLSVQPNLLGGTYILFIDRESRSGIHVDQELKAEIASIPTLSARLKSIVRIPEPVTK